MHGEPSIAPSFSFSLIECRPRPAARTPRPSDGNCIKEEKHAREIDAGGWADADGSLTRSGGRLGGSRAPVADAWHHRTRRQTAPAGAVGPLPRLAARVCGALGLAHAHVLPLPRPARLLTHTRQRGHVSPPRLQRSRSAGAGARPLLAIPTRCP